MEYIVFQLLHCMFEKYYDKRGGFVVSPVSPACLLLATDIAHPWSQKYGITRSCLSTFPLGLRDEMLKVRSSSKEESRGGYAEAAGRWIAAGFFKKGEAFLQLQWGGKWLICTTRDPGLTREEPKEEEEKRRKDRREKKEKKLGQGSRRRNVSEAGA